MRLSSALRQRARMIRQPSASDITNNVITSIWVTTTNAWNCLFRAAIIMPNAASANGSSCSPISVLPAGGR